MANSIFTQAFLDSYKGHPKFLESMEQIIKLHNKKSNDYASCEDPFKNLKECEVAGIIEAWKGVVIRLCDKFERLKNAASGKRLQNETVHDTFQDIAVYSMIGDILYHETQKTQKKEETSQKGEDNLQVIT